MENKTYDGACHCGKIRYRVTTDLAHVMQCNCSICSKRGYLLTFVTPEQFKQLSGQDSVRDYQFNKHIIHHYFCTTCGVGSYAQGAAQDGKKMYAINVRCLDDVDPSTLNITQFDGKKL